MADEVNTAETDEWLYPLLEAINLILAPVLYNRNDPGEPYRKALNSAADSAFEVIREHSSYFDEADDALVSHLKALWDIAVDAAGTPIPKKKGGAGLGATPALQELFDTWGETLGFEFNSEFFTWDDEYPSYDMRSYLGHLVNFTYDTSYIQSKNWIVKQRPGRRSKQVQRVYSQLELAQLDESQSEYDKQYGKLRDRIDQKLEAKTPLSAAEISEFKALNRIRETTNNARIKAFLGTAPSGQPVDVSRLRESLGPSVVPEAFEGKAGLVDGTLRFYTIFDEVLDGVPRGDLVMNDNYVKGGRESVFNYTTPISSSRTYVFTADYKQENRNQQEYAGAKLQDRAFLRAAKVKWRQLLFSDKWSDQQLGAIIEILYHTGARVGADRQRQSEGILSLCVRSVEVRGNKVEFRYEQKGAPTPQHYILDPTKTKGKDKKALQEVIDLFEESITEEDDPQRQIFDLSYTVLRRRIKKIFSMQEMTPHKLRHLKATSLLQPRLNSALREIKKAQSGYTEKQYAREVARRLEEEAKEVGRVLGHSIGTATDEDGGTIVKVTGSVVLNSYTMPSVVINFFNQAGTEIPRKYLTMYKIGH